MRFVRHDSSSPLATSWAGAEAMADALACHPDLAGFSLTSGSVEAHTALLVGMADTGPTAVSIDASDTLGPTLRDAPQAEELATAIVGPRGLHDDRVLDLRSQLLIATAGAIAAAAKQGADNAVLLVHEFIGGRTADAAREQNAQDLHDFAMTVFHFDFPQNPPWCAGPFHVHGDDPHVPARIRLYLAKASTDW
jgi:hypothetical protein